MVRRIQNIALSLHLLAARKQAYEIPTKFAAVVELRVLWFADTQSTLELKVDLRTWHQALVVGERPCVC